MQIHRRNLLTGVSLKVKGKRRAWVVDHGAYH
jgi:hypothetical protein